MQTLPTTLSAVILPFTHLFRKSIHQRVSLALCAAILAPAQRTIAASLRIIGRGNQPDFQQYHRLLNRIRWSPLRASKILLEMILKEFIGNQPVRIIIDETLERRRGKKIDAKGIYRDALRSSRSHFVKASGLRWLSIQILVELPFSQRHWALPVMTILAPSQRYCQEVRCRHKKLTDWARQGLLQLRRWLPHTPDERRC